MHGWLMPVGGLPTAIFAMREGQPLLHDLGDLVPGGDQLEYPPVDFPIADLLGPVRVVSEVDDVQPVPEIVKNDATLAAEDPDRPGLVQGLYIRQTHLLAPVAGGRLESEFLWRRAGGEQHDIGIRRADARLVGRALVAGKQSVSHGLRSPRQDGARPVRHNGR